LYVEIAATDPSADRLPPQVFWLVRGEISASRCRVRSHTKTSGSPPRLSQDTKRPSADTSMLSWWP
jgi:hypothetical protein